MTTTPADPPMLASSEEPRLRSVETVRTCAAVLAAMLMAGTIINPLVGDPEDFSWIPLMSTAFWGSVVLGLSWQRPKALAAAGTVLVVGGMLILLTLSVLASTVQIDEEDLLIPRDAVANVLQLVIIGALLIGGAVALMVAEVEELQGSDAYGLTRIVAGILAGAVAGGLTVILGSGPDLLENADIFYVSGVLLLVGTAVTASVAVSPVAVVPVVVGILLLSRDEGWSEVLYGEQTQELARHRLQLIIVVLAATASSIPFRPFTGRGNIR